MDKKHQEMSPNGFSPFMTPKHFFKNKALSLLYPYGDIDSCKQLEKTNGQSLRYLKTDGRTDHGRTRAITKALSLLYPYGALTSCKKLEKTNVQSLEIFKDTETNRPKDQWTHQ